MKLRAGFTPLHRRIYRWRSDVTGFTLIELLVAISLSIIILSTVYFSLYSAIESWHYSREELALQQVVSEILEEIIEGNDWDPGVRSAVEISRAWESQLEFVRPWSEEVAVGGGRGSFQLSHHIKPGAGLPTAELRLPDTAAFRPLPVSWEDPDNLTERPRLKPAYDLIPGSTVRFSYYPDPARTPEAVITLRWDETDRAIYREAIGNNQRLGANPFGVMITDCRFRYYDVINNLVSEYGDVPESNNILITAVEVQVTGQLGKHTLTLPGMVMLRNSSRQSGLVILRSGLRVTIPGSQNIKTFTLTNLIGITHEDEIQLEVRPATGRAWRVTVRFERYGRVKPVIGQVTVEYPPGQAIFTERPRTDADLGLNLLTIGPGGLYDYDDDPEIEDPVLVDKEPATLIVTKMDIHGAACFIQP